MLSLEKRKQNRLGSYDYSQNGAYFLTICTRDMGCIFWNDQTFSYESPDDTSHLSLIGLAADTAVREISHHYSGVTVDKYVVMPNHLHIILLLARDQSMPGIDVSRIVQQLKAAVTKKAGPSLWQRSFHDRVIRDEKEYLAIWEYIQGNPIRWKEDCYCAGEKTRLVTL